MEASKEDRHLADFRYACAGYSMYLDRIKEDPSQKNTLELPVCVGLEVISHPLFLSFAQKLTHNETFYYVLI